MKRLLIGCIICTILFHFSQAKNNMGIEKHDGLTITAYELSKPEIFKELYGELEGQKVYRYTLKNTKGMIVKVITYGGSITEVITPDKNGKPGDIVLGFDSLPSYAGPVNHYFGALVGRYGNRIANAKFSLDGVEYTLTGNLHGGTKGFYKRIWNAEEVKGNKEVALKLTYFSKDGEEGYPGNLNVTVIYTLTNNNELKIDYSATTDKATPCNLTNHTFWDLSAGKAENVLNNELTILADQYTEIGTGIIPTGNLPAVKDTPMDFTTAHKIGERITADYAQLKFNNDYDHNWVLRNKSGKIALAARAYEPLSGRIMEVYTTEPGIQFYAGYGINKRFTGKNNKVYPRYAGLALETQHFPDSPNHPNFPNTILRPGETYKSHTIYKFSVGK